MDESKIFRRKRPHWSKLEKSLEISSQLNSSTNSRNDATIGELLVEFRGDEEVWKRFKERVELKNRQVPKKILQIIQNQLTSTRTNIKNLEKALQKRDHHIQDHKKITRNIKTPTTIEEILSNYHPPKRRRYSTTTSLKPEVKSETNIKGDVHLQSEDEKKKHSGVLVRVLGIVANLWGRQHVNGPDLRPSITTVQTETDSLHRDGEQYEKKKEQPANLEKHKQYEETIYEQTSNETNSEEESMQSNHIYDDDVEENKKEYRDTKKSGKASIKNRERSKETCNDDDKSCNFDDVNGISKEERSSCDFAQTSVYKKKDKQLHGHNEKRIEGSIIPPFEVKIDSVESNTELKLSEIKTSKSLKKDETNCDVIYFLDDDEHDHDTDNLTNKLKESCEGTDVEKTKVATVTEVTISIPRCSDSDGSGDCIKENNTFNNGTSQDVVVILEDGSEGESSD